jgi:uncharacterized membrane-anchored protein
MASTPQLPALRIHEELHARVAEPVTAPCRIRHSAYLLPENGPDGSPDSGPAGRDAVRRAFEHIATGLNIPKENILWGERSGRVETALTHKSRLRVVWELHSEFYSYTTFHMLESSQAAEQRLVPAFTFPAMPTLGTKLVDVDMVVMPGTKLTEPLLKFLSEHAGVGSPSARPIYGGPVVAGAGRVWTTFQVDEWGQGRYVVRAGSLEPGRLGRLIRRLFEIENYYHLILLPLEAYRTHVGPLQAMEERIATRSRQIATALSGPDSGLEDEHRWLVSLTTEMAELTHLSERLRHSFSAAESYYAILEERLRWLREQTGEGFQTLGEFLTARVAPAVRNYRNFSERVHALTLQLTSMGNVLRTRVNLSMEHQSLATMRAMDRRFELQLNLQFTVEGLSIIVLSYYLTGLSSYALKALDHLLQLPGPADYWVAGTIPIWLSLAYAFTHRVKKLAKAYMHDEETADRSKPKTD